MATQDLAAWRALVDKELAGAPFDKLIQRTAEGVVIEPLYTERTIDPGLPGAAPFTRGGSASPAKFRICMKVDSPGVRRPGALDEDLDGGADALWVGLLDFEANERARQRGLPVVQEPPEMAVGGPAPEPDLDAIRALKRRLRELEPPGGAPPSVPCWTAFDYITGALRGAYARDAVPQMLRSLVPMALDMTREPLEGGLIRVSGLAFHEAGADAADELALMLASAAAYLRALTDGGLAVDVAMRALWTQISVYRDTFGELCKLRALRVCWHKLAVAAGAPDVAPPMLHAVCSTRAQSQRDPWVNMLRVTTQVFAAALGGADLITPLAFDEALGPPSAAGRRAARNAALVLREESSLGRVIDPAGGSYYLEARTDQLAREAWRRFTEIERDGGIVPLIVQGKLTARLEAAWAQRAAAIARRKEPVLGVSEFANLDEKLPAPVPTVLATASVNDQFLPHLAHRDAEGFEALRARVEAAPRGVALVLLGPPAEHRARSGFAEGFFAVAGLRTALRALGQVLDHATSQDAAAKPAAGPSGAGRGLDIACLCGSDERYATDAVAAARALKASGARRVVLAGRSGGLEADLRGAGVDAFIYVGCDLLATLEEILA